MLGMKASSGAWDNMQRIQIASKISEFVVFISPPTSQPDGTQGQSLMTIQLNNSQDPWTLPFLETLRALVNNLSKERGSAWAGSLFVLRRLFKE